MSSYDGDHRYPRPGDPGFPRQSHGGGGRHCWKAAPSAGRRSPPGRRPVATRRWSAATATARATAARGSRRRGRGRGRDLRCPARGYDGRRAGGDRPHHDRAGRHRRTRAAWAPTPFSASPWRSPRRRPRRPACRSTAMSAAPMPERLPVPMMNIINGGAHADNAHRLPGVHDHAGGGRVLRREALRMRLRRSFTVCGRTLAARRATTPTSATKAALRTGSGFHRGGARLRCQGLTEAAGYASWATRWCWRWTVRCHRVL